MRVIAGKLKGREIKAPEGKHVRPTTDRMRESLFSMLVHQMGGCLTGLKVLDAFAGTGALGIEALSRGVDHVTFVEKDKRTANIINENIKSLQLKEHATLINNDLFSIQNAASPADLIFLDPPYEGALYTKALSYLENTKWIGSHTIIMIECDKNIKPDWLHGFTILKERTIARSRILFIQKEN